MGFDVIGDIHGHSKTLISLLQNLGYELSKGAYQHPERKVIFLGDFIDRGPHQREVIEIVRPMIESGAALSVLGNHEFNAIAFATASDDGYLRPHTDKNLDQHKAFLAEYPLDSPEYADVIEWFKTLPLWIDLGDIRVVHACWDQGYMEILKDKRLTDELLIDACDKATPQYSAIETLLKGKEIPLPEGQGFHDKDGHERHDIRIRWWDRGVKTYKEAFIGPESAVTHIPDEEIEGDHVIDYSHAAPPVFLGHYWLEGTPERLAPNIACVDYSVGKPGGKLVVYRWAGEQQLLNQNFVAEPRS